ncbi:MAG: YraN family protein [Candidatus Ornithomonoglobus sp.]
MDRQRIGELGEEAASRFLVKKGYQIRERNFRLQCGELDIVAVDRDNCLVFVEVKTRKNDEYGYPSEYVNAKKQEKLKKTALLYCGGEVCNMRFDIIEVYYKTADNKMYVRKINHIEDAF